MPTTPPIPDRVSRRTALKLGGGLLGTTLLAGPAGARTDDLVLDLRQEAINPDEQGRIPVRIRGYPMPDSWTPDDVYFGHAEQFTVQESEGVVFLPENPTEVLAQPVEDELLPTPDSWIKLHFRAQDIDFSAVSGADASMGLGLYPAPDSWTPASRFDSDSARFVDAVCPECRD